MRNNSREQNKKNWVKNHQLKSIFSSLWASNWCIFARKMCIQSKYINGRHGFIPIYPQWKCDLCKFISSKLKQNAIQFEYWQLNRTRDFKIKSIYLLRLFHKIVVSANFFYFWWFFHFWRGWLLFLFLAIFLLAFF